MGKFWPYVHIGVIAFTVYIPVLFMFPTSPLLILRAI